MMRPIHPVFLAPRLLACALPMLSLLACSKDNAVDSSTNVSSPCGETQETLASLCPPGTALDLSGSIDTGGTVCPGGEGEVKDASGNVTGVCRTTSSCSLKCKVVQTCPCGIESATKEGVKCRQCACGDGLCQGNERASCAANDAACVPCEEDCAGSNCGDKVCNGTENASTCPQDCAGTCTPNQPVCVGTKVLLCGANGEPAAEIVDCSANGQICGNGKCQAKDVCGNGVCDGAESAQLCPQDCQTVCVPGSVACKDATHVTSCSADGKTESVSDCPAGFICGNGKCGAAGVCGNGLCEASESITSCSVDCKPNVCGNGQCEIGESNVICPSDCSNAVCGNAKCEKDEPKICQQDCPQMVCTPDKRRCQSLQILEVCSANGMIGEKIDCAQSGQVCGAGQCVPPLVCGNGVCESGESIATCVADCTGACGNTLCDKPYENASKCSDDCPDECGDGYCTGVELPQTCTIDCPVNCGNGTCDTGETRKNCSVDCGFCGDGKCQAEETPAPVPPPDGSKEACALDCLKINCTIDTDCDDQIACTMDDCDALGKCHNIANDSVCGPNSQCLGLAALPLPGTGCCADADGDSYPAASCGGNDCYDTSSQPDANQYGTVAPALVHPNAIGEACDGIDRNCNLANKPKVTANDTTLPLTPVGSDPKLSFDVAVEPTQTGTVAHYLLAWTAMTDNGVRLQYAVTDSDGLINSSIGVQTVTTDPAELAGVLYSPHRKQFALAWTTCGLMVGARNRGHVAWIPSSGATAGQLIDQVDVGDLHFECSSGKPSKATFARVEDSVNGARYSLFQMGGALYNGGCGLAYPDGAGRPNLIGEDGAVTQLPEGPGWGCNGGSSVTPVGFINRRTRFIFYSINNANASGAPFGVFTWRPSGEYSNIVPVAEFNWRNNTPVLGFDGTAIVAIANTPNNDGLLYQRVDPLQYTGYDAATSDPAKMGQFIKAQMNPVSITTNSLDTLVAVAGTEKTTSNSVLMLLRKQSDGTKVVDPGTVAKGTAIANIRTIWDGLTFRTFYTSTIQGRQQVFMAPLQCD